MPNVQRLCVGATEPIRVQAAASVAIFVGDNVFQVAGNAYPTGNANANDWGSATAAVKQAAAKAAFLGISADARLVAHNTVGDILVHPSGVATCVVKDEAAKPVGTLYAFTNAATNTLVPNSYEATTNETLAVASLLRDKAANALTARLRIFGRTSYITA